MKGGFIINRKKIFNLAALCIAGSVIYELAYLSYSYYDVMVESFGISNSQMGILMSVFGVVATLCYFPGGWIADRLPLKKLIIVSLLITGVLGLWEMSMPGFYDLLLIYFLWGIALTFTFWAPMLKATEQLGSSNEQGKLFGSLEAGRGIIPMLYGLAIVEAFQSVGGKTSGLQRVIFLYSILNFIGAILVLLFMQEQTPKSLRDEKKASISKNIVILMKKPTIWLVSGVVFVSYCIYTSFSFLTPFLINYCKITTSTAAAIAIIRTYGIAVIGGIFSGFMADKIGSRIKMLFHSFFVCIVGISLLFCVRAGRQQLIILGAVLITGLGIFMTRSLYFAVLDDIHIERQMSGLAIGLVSFVGFIPEIFMYPLIGGWLDQYQGEKPYIMIFILMLVCSLIGLLLSVHLKICTAKQSRLSVGKT